MKEQLKPQGGATANDLGAHEEERISKWLAALGYQCADGQDRIMIVKALNAGAPVLALVKPGFFYRQLPAYKSIFGVIFKADFVVVPFSNSRPVLIELKSQTSAGSVDEKLPFWLLTLNAVTEQGMDTILAVLGDGARKGALDWCFQNRGKTEMFTSAQGLKARLNLIK